MQKFCVFLAALSLALSAGAAERSFHFGSYALDQTPDGFRSVLAGQGKPGDWRIIEDEASSAMQKISENAPITSKRNVLAQLSQDPTDERFPILVFDGENFGDFTLTTKFKLVGGALEQMAGVVFRLRDEQNFYVIRVSGLGKNLRFYKVVGGIRSAPIGPEIEITKNVWHTLSIMCKGNQIRCRLDGRDALPTLTDNSFTSGKIGFWTKSDSLTYFGDTDLVYKPRVPLAQLMVDDLLKKQKRLRGISVYASDPETGALKIIASNDENLLGQSGTDLEEKTFKTDAIFQAKSQGMVQVVMPLHDRNGETVAVVQLDMESFPGQTEQNVLARATPIVKLLQNGIRSVNDLAD